MWRRFQNGERRLQATISQVLVAEREVAKDIAAETVRIPKTANRYQEVVIR